jgi:hypothetical protein
LVVAIFCCLHVAGVRLCFFFSANVTAETPNDGGVVLTMRAARRRPQQRWRPQHR